MRNRVFVAGFVLLAAGLQTGQAADPTNTVRQLLARENMQAGLCILLGRFDGRLAAALANEGWLVHALADDRVVVESARRHLASQHVYGQASVERAENLALLPYADSLANLVVIDDLECVGTSDCSFAEIERILTPGGIVIVSDGDAKHSQVKWKELIQNTGLRASETGRSLPGWFSAVKRRPPGMDQWTHHRHGADGNRFSSDAVVGIPSGPRWIAGPEFSDRSYRNMIVTDRRLFTITRNRHQAVQYLSAHDAYNGLLLWQRAIRLPKQSTASPFQQDRHWPLVADEERVFLRLEDGIAALDAASGETILKYEIGETSPESIRDLLFADGSLIVVAIDRIAAFDAQTARQVWSSAARTGDVVIGDGKVLFSAADRETRMFHVVGLELTTGRELWRSRIDDIQAMHIDRRGNLAADKLQIFHQQGYVIVAGSDSRNQGSLIATLASRDGQLLASYATDLRRVDQIFFRDGLIWVPPSLGIDPRTGTVVKRLTGGGGWGAFSSSTCQAPVCTPRFVFSPKPSLRAYEFATSRVRNAPFTLATCGIGTIPANGLLYNSAQTGCLCSQGAIHGLTALESAEAMGETSHPLEKGPAYGETIASPVGEPDRDWPMFRHDALRSGTAGTNVAARLKVSWQSRVSANSTPAALSVEMDGVQVPDQRITPPVVANGKVLIAEIDSHRVVALDASNGRLQWSFTAGGRIDSPPSVQHGLCLFGSHDGWVYCLRLDDGRMVWRLRAAPLAQRIVAFGQLESSWPVCGSLLALNDVVYATAGRSSAARGGITAFALQPRTGEVLWKQDVSTGLNDLLVSDGRSLYLRNMRLDPQTGRSTLAARLIGFKGPGEVLIPGDPERGPARPAYLYGGWFSSLIDGSWRYAKTTYAKGNQRRTYDGRTFGQVIVFDEQRSFAYQTGFWSGDHLYGGPRYPASLSAALHVAATGDRNGEPARRLLWKQETALESWVEAMTLTPDVLFVAGPVDRRDRREKGGFLSAISPGNGKTLATHPLPSPPCLEGLAAAHQQLFVSTADGHVVCFAQE